VIFRGKPFPIPAEALHWHALGALRDIALLLLITLSPFLFLIPGVNLLNAIYDQTNADRTNPFSVRAS